MIQWLKQLENIFAHHNRFQELLIKEESDCETVSTLIENLIDEYNNRFSYYDENLQRLVMLILNILSRNVLQGAVKPFGTNIDEPLINKMLVYFHQNIYYPEKLKIFRLLFFCQCYGYFS